MDNVNQLRDILATSQTNIPILGFIFGLLLATILGYVLARVFIKFANVMSNRKTMAFNLMLLVIITSLVISIVKSSLALSLGLVGALSIVRFRTAIKEPEELIYLFIAIAVGLGIGANQFLITAIAFLVIIIIIIIVNKFYFNQEDNYNLHLIVSNKDPQKTKLEKVVETLKLNCEKLELKRLDESSDYYEALFLVNFQNFDQLNQARESLREIDKNLSINILENKPIQ